MTLSWRRWPLPLLTILIVSFSGLALTNQVQAMLKPLTSSNDSVDVSVIVNDTTLVVNGKTAPSSFVTVLVDGRVVGATTSDSAGFFKQKVLNLKPGLHNVKVYAKDASNRVTDTVGQTINVLEKDITTYTVYLPPVIYIQNSPPSVIVGRTVSISGSTWPGATVLIRIDNNQTYTAKASAKGLWNFSFATDGFYVGTHVIAALASDGSGQSQLTAARLFEVTASSEAAQAINGIPLPPTILEPKHGSEVDTRSVVVSGLAEPNSQLELYDGDSILGSVFANSQGQWQLPLLLNKTNYSFRAKACNEFGCSDYSNTVQISVNGGALGLGKSRMFMSSYSFRNIRAGQFVEIELSVDGQGRFDALVDWGDGTVERLTFDDTNKMTISHKYDSPGRYNGHIALLDEEGAVETQFFSVFVENVVDTFPFIRLWLFLITLMVALIYAHRRHKRYGYLIRSSAHPRF